MGRARGVNQRASKVCSRGRSRCEDAGGDGGVRRRNLNHPLARDDDAVNNDRHGKQDKTGFISREIPFLPGDRDTTVPATQCNGLCHVTLSHTYSCIARTAQQHRALQTRSKKVFKREVKTHTTHLNVQGCGIVAPPMHAPSRTPFLIPLLLSHNALAAADACYQCLGLTRSGPISLP